MEHRTAPPVRLRMRSADPLCLRSMEVEWEDGTGVRSRWSSWTDEAAAEPSWYEAEKLLPSSATDIQVTFVERGLGGPRDVCRVSRRSGCSWVVEGGEHVPEVIVFRHGHDASLEDEVDAVFELCGPMQACYVVRAWNAARPSRVPPSPWEFWEDRSSCPSREPRCPTIEAADGAAPIAVALGNPRLYSICATKRLAAALRALLEVHRDTLQGLRVLDSRFTSQWLGVNCGNTASAGLGIASAVCLFSAPPVGVGLGLGSAAVGGATFAGDSVADRAHSLELKRQLSRDALNAFVVAELLKEWIQARQSLLTFSSLSMPTAAPSMDGSPLLPTSFTRTSSVGTTLGQCGLSGAALPLCGGAAIDTSLTAGAFVDGLATAGTRIADQLGKAAMAASQVLGIAGALISTGFMIRGWSTSKAGQMVARELVEELTVRVLLIQQLLASIDRLECPLCAEAVILADNVQRCSASQHCFHAVCLRRCRAAGARCTGADECPECGSAMEQEELMVEAIERKQLRRRDAGPRTLRAQGRCTAPGAPLPVEPAAFGLAGGTRCRAAQEALLIPPGGRRRPKTASGACGFGSCSLTC